MKRKNQTGITLIELMIVVVIVGILASVAYPSYRSSVMRSNRTDGRVALTRAAEALEKCFTRSMTYVGCPAPPGNSEAGKYTVAVASTATTFTVTAAAQGSQASDTTCAALTLDQTGQKLPAACW